MPASQLIDQSVNDISSS